MIAPAVLEQPPAEADRRRAPGALTAALGITAVATIGFGLAAEPLLRLAERATMLT